MSDIIDAIDALVDEQLEQERSGYDHNINQVNCPHCGRDWHGLPITQAIERMRALGQYDEKYDATQDDSPILCPGSEFIGPIPLSGVYCSCPFCYMESMGVPPRILEEILNNAAQSGSMTGAAAISLGADGTVSWRTVGTLQDGTEIVTQAPQTVETVDPENAITPADFGEQPCN
ncbi:hypothetical protein [Mycobacteroides abscessus]|uniref:hypothetical protein n=1 Tax=Mycobacteroides abscessus TaxID=36809 RepID=UPI000925BDD3|nr:hypothetical protein [Mycobacteroides abscessus]SKS05295.1 Uncharacterised protein [Mycobacteroides abscessus subsp. abscessus]SHU54488.1 Uncharacterised protein [Mycobacteroides abscessus subsp. bolletii]SHW63119.1 Uncharacterised protein [Mycobacteroides abscessus subsp. bolletii]SHW91155.1 Uncharacterised protein [Mycobacteroides abscessus subsp. bolletii]SHX34093.1 Uncharacterised protein [Mycobacteroides abscessus subsp. bolletii]